MIFDHLDISPNKKKKQVSFSLSNELCNEPIGTVDHHQVKNLNNNSNHNNNKKAVANEENRLVVGEEEEEEKRTEDQMNGPTNYPYVRRRDTIVDENAMQALLLHESIWSHAFRKRRSHESHNRSRVQQFVKIIQMVYDKSRIHYFVPVILLIAYSVLGGLIFWAIEKPNEDVEIGHKTRYIRNVIEELVDLVVSMHDKLDRSQYYYNDYKLYHFHLRRLHTVFMNDVEKIVYWYTLSGFYLTENEMHKSDALRPRNVDRLFETNLGRISALRNFTNHLCQRCWEISDEGRNNNFTYEIYNKTIHEAIEQFNNQVGLENVLTPIWTFWNAMFLAVTTYTTIGYGNITARTRLGKLAAMLYAVVGIPLVLMILHKSGRLFLMGLEHFWDFILRVAEHFSFVTGRNRIRLSSEDRISEMPVILAIGVAFGWMFLCAAIFLKFEKDWDYFKSFYFFFCSLTTIGYGDVTPTNSEDMFIIFGLIIIGLSLVSMCINVIQLKLEKLFEELLLTLMEEYSADPDATHLKAGAIGMREMWRAWKKRKGRLGDGLERAKSARDAANEASKNFVKRLPFSRKRQRRNLIAELQKQMQRKDKYTQTDYGYMCEEAFTETSDVESCITDFRNSVISDKSQHLLLIPDGPFCGPSRCESRPVVALAEASLCSSSSNLPQSLASSSHRPSSTIPSSSAASAKSAPAASPVRLPPIDFDPTRRWTFVATNRNQRGCPRGLVPYMYTRPMNSVVHTSEVRRLIAEIDVRLQDCRSLATPANSIRGTVSGSSFSRSVISEASIPEEL
ncbi:unnamed protein product [Caenorhabditis angaria]|uniref:Potassium channel domain-containing protein n=1 Tax=Caenorhabditis angaria TaxID=860376 RepID=A0A9P1J120_9PELO|nr:unnamed protein product [Caenorhabditis angaria]